MPCGPRARLTAYVAYRSLAFSERDVLVAALTDLYQHIESAPEGTETSNPVPVLDTDRRVVGRAAIVIRREHMPVGMGDLGFVWSDGAYIPLLPGDGASEQVLRQLRAAYGRAKAVSLAEQARHRLQATVRRTTGADGTVTIQVRF
jgi:hypothetical protein